MRKIVFFILVLGLAIGILGYYYYQRNIYSREILRIEILGQEEPQAFEKIEYIVKYKNNGNVTLEDAQLLFQYPERSLTANGKMPREQVSLEDIYPGEEKTLTFSANLLGRAGETKTAKATLRYRPKNLKAFFESSTTFTSRIKSVPLTFELDLPSRVEPGKELRFFLNYFSNSDLPLSNLRARIEYPAEFEFLSSSPRALDKTEWDLPLLNKAEGGRIEIKGKLSGDIGEQKRFLVTLGLWQEGEFILLKETAKGAEIIRPSVFVFQQINGYEDYVASPGDTLHYEIFFRNMGQEPFQNLFLVANLEGAAFDFGTLRSGSGEFNEGDNFILWDWRQEPSLRFLAPGRESKAEFWITLKETWQPLPGESNFSLKNRIVLSQVREEFETKVNSRLEITQRADFDDEAFGNTGPVPPRVGQTTTYTILWQVKNYYNDVHSATVKAVLPPQTRLTGKIFPEDAPLTFDSASRELVWSLGDLAAGAGVSASLPTLAFQIAFTPDTSQTGQTAQIVSQVKVSGQDAWTGALLEKTDSPITAGPVQ